MDTEFYRVVEAATLMLSIGMTFEFISSAIYRLMRPYFITKGIGAFIEGLKDKPPIKIEVKGDTL